MQTRVNGMTSADNSSDESWITHEAGSRLIEEIRPLLEPHGVTPETFSKALNEALLDLQKETTDGSLESARELLLGLVLWKLFAQGSALWIGLRSEAGKTVPTELLVNAYSMWKYAANIAARQGVDSATAAEALVQVTHATANQIAKQEHDPDRGEIRDFRKYLFAAYRHAISDIAAKQGSDRTDYVDMEEWISNRELSDRGTFMEVVESGILCQELLDAMPRRARSVAMARYVLDYNWPETAGCVQSSINAAQKALSVGVRSAFGMCMQELRRIGHRKGNRVEHHMLKNGKNSLSR